MKRDVGALADGTFDLLVLGGGIVGAGVALDATLRGLRVALIDKGDFASGTSSVSSKLVHGGLRYLETGTFGLVYEALHERRLLLRNAPHLVRPLRFVIPMYRRARVARWKLRTGLTLYDLLAGPGNIRRSRPIPAPALLREFPGLRSRELLSGLEYWDAQMDDARLCVEVVRSAALAGARVCNYVEATAFETAGGRLAGVAAVDRAGAGTLAVRARQVLNATGPWVDEVCRLAGDPFGPKLEPTKGVHVVAPPRGLAAAFLLFHPADGRVFFVIPWMGKTLIGTTDTFTAAGPDGLKVERADIQYLLDGFNHHFDPGLKEDELLGSLVGLRPLIRGREGDPSSLSREYHLYEGPGGLLSAAGGKYTTYRHMAEAITRRVMQRLGRRAWGRTHAYPVDGAPRGTWAEFAPAALARLKEVHGLVGPSARHLVDRYGRRAEAVATYLSHGSEMAEPVVAGEPDLRAELAYQRDHEMALTRADHMLRRTRLGLFHPELLAP